MVHHYEAPTADIIHASAPSAPSAHAEYDYPPQQHYGAPPTSYHASGLSEHYGPPLHASGSQHAPTKLLHGKSLGVVMDIDTDVRNK